MREESMASDDLIDMIISDESPSNITDKIKDVLFAKSAERIDNSRPGVASNVFAGIAAELSNSASTEDSE
jgi:hypothetical protein